MELRLSMCPVGVAEPRKFWLSATLHIGLLNARFDSHMECPTLQLYFLALNEENILHRSVVLRLLYFYHSASQLITTKIRTVSALPHPILLNTIHGSILHWRSGRASISFPLPVCWVRLPHGESLGPRKSFYRTRQGRSSSEAESKGVLGRQENSRGQRGIMKQKVCHKIWYGCGRQRIATKKKHTKTPQHTAHYIKDGPKAQKQRPQIPPRAPPNANLNPNANAPQSSNKAPIR